MNGNDSRAWDGEYIAGMLGDEGWVVIDDWLPSTARRELAARCRTLGQGEHGVPAGIGAGNRYRVRADIRGDLVMWLSTEGVLGRSDAVRALLDATEALRIALNRHLQIGAFELEAHLAAYPPGTFYARHLDRFHDDDRRVVSMVHYFNDHWREAHGGQLRLYPGGVDAPPVDVAPLGGRSVFFLSERMHHEVLLTSAWRYSLTGWFRRH